jgi:hypothetical protein
MNGPGRRPSRDFAYSHNALISREFSFGVSGLCPVGEIEREWTLPRRPARHGRDLKGSPETRLKSIRLSTPQNGTKRRRKSEVFPPET